MVAHRNHSLVEQDVCVRRQAREWLIDGLDVWLARGRHRCAVLFVDNAGPDIVLGMIPLARHLLHGGTRVMLTANDAPSLNDVTIDELRDLIDRVGRLDSTIAGATADGRLRLVGSGNIAPLIDLSRVAPALCEAVETEPGGVDLVVLEGMGFDVERFEPLNEELYWESDKDGRLGKGPVVPTRDLSPGKHKITLRVGKGKRASRADLTIHVTKASIRKSN